MHPKFLIASAVFHIIILSVVLLYSSSNFTPPKTINTKVYFVKPTAKKTKVAAKKTVAIPTKKATPKKTVAIPTKKATPKKTVATSTKNTTPKKTVATSTKKATSQKTVPRIKKTIVNINNIDILKDINLNEETTVDSSLKLKQIQLKQPLSQEIQILQEVSEETIKLSEVKPVEKAENFFSVESPSEKKQKVEYKKIIGFIIKNNWSSSFDENSLQVIIKVKILKNGNLDYYEITQKSDLPVFDLSAVNAIKLSNPFPPIPNDLQKDEYFFYFRFQGSRIL